MEPARRDSRGSWRLIEGRGPVVASCALLEDVATVAHGFSTRRDDSSVEGTGDFDLGTSLDATRSVVGRRRRLCRQVGLPDRSPSVIRQVHGDRILELPVPSPHGPGREPPEADGVIGTRRRARGEIAGVRIADCVPVLLVDRQGGAVGAIHAGWRGVAAGIVARGVRGLDRLGFPPARLLAAIGPAVGCCCYEVGEEVVDAVRRATPGPPESFVRRSESSGPKIDLQQAISAQLGRAGLAEESVSRAPWCTVCRADLFFSYRREGPLAGRMMAVIGWIPSAP